MCSFSYLNFNFTNFWLMELIDFIPYKFTYTIKVESQKGVTLNWLQPIILKLMPFSWRDEAVVEVKRMKPKNFADKRLKSPNIF